MYLYAVGFFAVMGPPGTPDAIAKKVSDDLGVVLAKPEMVKRFEDIASYINPMSPTALRDYIKTEQALWKPEDQQGSRDPSRYAEADGAARRSLRSSAALLVLSVPVRADDYPSKAITGMIDLLFPRWRSTKA